MKKRILGRTGIEVSQIALGGLFVSDFGGSPFEEQRRAVHRALELGINYIDTAPSYANSEEVLGKCLKNVTNPFILSTKVGGWPNPFNPKDKAALRSSVERSLTLLGRSQIDILMVHEPDRPGQWDWWDDWDNFNGPVRELLDELKSEKIIRFTGLGGTTAYELARVMRCGYFDVVLTAFNYSLLWREASLAIFPEAVAQGMGIIVGSPLHQGTLSRRYDHEIEHGAPWLSPERRDQFRRLYRYLDEIKIPLPELGLRMILSNPNVSTVLTGSRNTEEVESNIAAAEKGPLSLDILANLQEIADRVPFRPTEEPPTLPFNTNYRGPGPAF